MGVFEALGLLLGLVGILFAFEEPRRRFLKLLGHSVSMAATAPTALESRMEHAKRLAAFVVEAQALKSRSREDPIPVGEHNTWVERASDYLREHLGEAYVVRFGDFSGMTFYGDGSERSKYERSLDGRSRRLNEFIKELSTAGAH